MNVLILGASGRVGSLLVSEMLQRGHRVIAFIHGPSHLKKHTNLRIVRGDVHEKNDLKAALYGADVVISTLGSWGTQQKDILSVAMRNIVPLMEDAGISRIVSLTGADARMHGEKRGAIHNVSHRLLSIAGGKVLKDAEAHLQLLKESDLDWTVLRSPVMTGKKHTLKYKITFERPQPWQTIPRRCVAIALATIAEDRRYPKHAPFIVSA